MIGAYCLPRYEYSQIMDLILFHLQILYFILQCAHDEFPANVYFSKNITIDYPLYVWRDSRYVTLRSQHTCFLNHIIIIYPKRSWPRASPLRIDTYFRYLNTTGSHFDCDVETTIPCAKYYACRRHFGVAPEAPEYRRVKDAKRALVSAALGSFTSKSGECEVDFSACYDRYGIVFWSFSWTESGFLANPQ